MDKQPMIFKVRRACCVCGSDATPGRARVAGEPNILAITPVMYRRGQGKGALKNAPRVQVCENCLIRALVPSKWGMGSTGSKLWADLRAALSDGYSALIEGDN